MKSIERFKKNTKSIEGRLRKKRIVVVSGGFSEERETSIESGDAVFTELKNKGFNVLKIDPIKDDILSFVDKNDIVFNCIHGVFGESGHLPAILDYLEIPYTFSGVYASAVSMDKIFFKAVLKKIGIPCLKDNFDKNKLKDGETVIHKKVRGGSSLGMVISKNKNSKDGYISELFVAGKPLTVGILEKEGKFETLGIVEVKLSGDIFYSEKVKFGGLGEYQKYSGNLSKVINNYAIEVAKFIGVKGCARVDFVQHKNKVYMLELNSVPGIHMESNLIFSAMLGDLSFYELILWILDGACFEDIRLK